MPNTCIRAKFMESSVLETEEAILLVPSPASVANIPLCIPTIKLVTNPVINGLNSNAEDIIKETIDGINVMFLIKIIIPAPK